MKSHKFIAPKWWAVNLRNGGHPPRSRAAKKKILIVERWGKYILEEYDRIKLPSMVYDLVCMLFARYDSNVGLLIPFLTEVCDWNSMCDAGHFNTSEPTSALTCGVWLTSPAQFQLTMIFSTIYRYEWWCRVYLRTGSIMKQHIVNCTTSFFAKSHQSWDSQVLGQWYKAF